MQKISRTHRTRRTRRTRRTKKNTNKNTNKKSKNHLIIQILTLVKDYYKDQNNKLKVKIYERAIYQIKKWNKPIVKGSDVLHLEGIGKGMVDKIDTIISSGTLPIIKEQNIHDGSVSDASSSTVQTILGFNKTFLNEIKTKYNARTINDFRKYINEYYDNHMTHIQMTHIQKLGLKYYEDLHDLIPRSEITYLGNKLKTLIQNRVMISGSYPSHSKEYSKDIDIIIVKNTNSINGSGELKNIINDILYNKSNKSNKLDLLDLEIISLGEKKFMGLIKSPISNKMRHIDIRLVSIDELPYTWFYYSSGQTFNIIIRKHLKKKGYKLNEYGLYKIDTNEKVNINGSSSSPDYTLDTEKDLLNYIENIEREIFKFADMEYKNVKARY